MAVELNNCILVSVYSVPGFSFRVKFNCSWTEPNLLEKVLLNFLLKPRFREYRMVCRHSTSV